MEDSVVEPDLSFIPQLPYTYLFIGNQLESATICQQTAMPLLLSVTQLVHWGQVAGQCRGPFVGAGVVNGWSLVNHKDNTFTDNNESTKISKTLYIHHHKCV